MDRTDDGDRKCFANLIASSKSTLQHQANQSSLKGEGLIECKSSKQKLGLIGLQIRSSLNQALVFSLIVDKSAKQASSETIRVITMFYKVYKAFQKLCNPRSMSALAGTCSMYEPTSVDD
jgi:hypothetical protein